MAKKTAEKKSATKKPRRRLKRTARRSLAAVMMITAVVVAAIPVQENVAADPKAMAGITARAADVHTEALADFKYNAKDKEVKDTTTATWAKANLNEFVKVVNGVSSLDVNAIWDSYNKVATSTKKPVEATLTVRDVGGNDTLTWQFLYYDVDIKGAGINATGTREVICMYNGEFTSNGIDIPLILNTEYYTVEESVISNYFKGLRPDGKALDSTDPGAASWASYVDTWPDTEYTYTLEDYRESLKPNNIPTGTLKFFTDYFAADDELRALNRKYQSYLDSYDKDTGSYDENLIDKQKDVLVRHPSDIKNADDQISFYCAHDNVLMLQAEPYTLVAVQDQRPNKSGKIYVAKGGKPSSIKPYYDDGQGYLVTKQSQNFVCGIGGCTFAGSDRIRNLELSSMINFIGDHAFEKASLISSIKIESASFIGNQAFKDCGSLKTVEFVSETNATNTIGAECFYGTKVTSIQLPSTIQSIGYGAFAHCEQLTTVDLNTISQDCKIDGYAFYECPALTTVNMKDAQVLSIGDAAFACTGGAKLDFTFPKGMTSEGNVNSIGDFMFAGRTNLNSVVFPEKYGATSTAAVKLPSNMFHECISLSYVKFPNEDREYDCGYIDYDKDKLFADVANEKFYVQGPKMRSLTETATPRRTTWSAVMAIEGNPIPYLYIENGKEYYEVSNGDYLYCVDPNGVITSCTLSPDANLDMIKDKGIDLEIVSQVGSRKVTGLLSGCFTDENLNQNVKSLTISDDSLSSIGEDVFKGWKRLKKVRIGDSVKEIGARAFAECDKLIDVTFSSPDGFAHKDFKIGDDAFKTGSTELTFHGDIVQGYAPFDWAMDPNNIIDKDRKDSDGNSISEGIRVCYKSMAPTFITVMYNPITDMVTMLDYPKADQVKTILSDLHGGGDYNRYRENVLYDFYKDSRYDDNRRAFANAWKAALTKEQKDAVYASDNYGPWVDPIFVGVWESYVTQTAVPTPGGTTSEPSTETGASAGMMDWLFEPLTVYAADESPENYKDPEPYYAHEGNAYDVLMSTSERGKYRPSTPEEDYLLAAIENIVVPEGVQSIDVYGFVNDLDEHGKEYKSTDPNNAKTNNGNLSRYFTDPGSNNKWDSDTEKMYTINSVFSSADGESSTVKSVAGLFSGYYVEPGESNARGNDTIRTVTMNSVKYLPNYAFDNCEKLQTVILGKDCADIGVAPFRGCKALRSVSNNDYYETDNGIIYSKKADGSYMIEECFASRGDLDIVGQPTVSLSHDPKLAAVTEIRPGAFEDCDVINMVLFGAYSPDGLTKIPENCFKDCNALQEITLPSNVNDIEKGAFAGSNSLTKLTIYGKEVKISGQAFNDDQKKQWTTVKSYEDSAVARYVKEYGTPFKLQMDEEKLGELWEVTFVGPDYAILDNLVDQNGEKISNPQYVQNGLPAKVPKNPEMDGWTFDKWVGLNGTELGGNIYEDTIYFAQGYSNSGMVNGKYVVNYIDSVDGTTFATEYVSPGADAPDLRAPIHKGYEFEKWNGELTNIQTNTNIVAMYKVLGGANTSGGTTNTPGGTTNTPGGTTNTSGGTTNTSGNTTSSSTSSGSTSTTSTTSADSRAASMHRVTVVGGSGSGTYATGATVVISANEPAAGMKFTGWTTESSGVTLNQMTASSTMFVMPENDVLVVANFEGGTAAAPVGTPAVVPTSNSNETQDNGNTRVDITKPGISNKDLATANVNGSSDNFIIKISETDEATRAVAAALTNKYGNLENILYYAMDITLWDATGSYQITGDQLNGISVDITIPIPDSLVAYGGNNKAGAVINGDQMESLNENFTTINGVPCIRFHATHFSPYTIYVDTGNLVEGMLDTTPKTGDPIHPKWFLSLGLACLSIILFMKKDKKVAVKA